MILSLLKSEKFETVQWHGSKEEADEIYEWSNSHGCLIIFRCDSPQDCSKDDHYLLIVYPDNSTEEIKASDWVVYVKQDKKFIRGTVYEGNFWYSRGEWPKVTPVWAVIEESHMWYPSSIHEWPWRTVRKVDCIGWTTDTRPRLVFTSHGTIVRSYWAEKSPWALQHAMGNK